VAVERRHCTSARCGHCSTCASDQMLRRIIPTAERTVTRGGNKTIDKGDAIRERPHGKRFLRVERFGRLRSYVRPQSVRSICPRALMKSDDWDPYQTNELYAHESWRVVPGLRWRPCRSSRLVALAKLEPVNLPCEHALRRRAASLCLREHLGAEAFAGLHHRPEDPGQLVSERHSNHSRWLLRQKHDDPVAQGAFALAYDV